MKKIEIFDPAMCCPTGMCGPSVDPELIRMAAVVHNLQKKGFPITRYNLATEPDAFVTNETVNRLLQEKGPDILPLVLVDGMVSKEKGYLTNEEFTELTGVPETELSQKPKMRLSLNVGK